MPRPLDPSAPRPSPSASDERQPVEVKALPTSLVPNPVDQPGHTQAWSSVERRVSVRATDVLRRVGDATSLVKVITRDVEESLRLTIDYVNDPARFTQDTALRDLRLIYSLLLSASPEQVDLDKLKLPGHASAAIEQVLDLQQSLTARLHGFGAGYSREIADEMRNVDRALQHLGDTLVLLFLPQVNEAPKPPIAAQVPNVHWQVDLSYANLNDYPDTFFVLTDEGTEVGNTIKTIMSVNAMGSHVAMVSRQRDPVTGKVSYWLGEALPGPGFTVKPLDPKQWFQKNVRSMLFVPSNEKLQRAFDAVVPDWLKMAKERQDKGDAIPYNFTLNPDDREALFCSQMIRQLMAMPAFKAQMGTSAPMFPAFPSQFQSSQGTHDMLSAWGIKRDHAIAPGDIAIDPSFRLVATARSLPGPNVPKDIRKGRLYASVYSVIFNDWLQNKGYRLRMSRIYQAATLALLGVRHIPLVGDALLGGVMPKSIPSGVLGTVVAMRRAADLIYKELEKANNVFATQHGREMTFNEMRAALEEIRLQDLERYRPTHGGQRGEVIFSHLFTLP
ncbi:MAG: hypothetical protein K1X64_18280 [Myxococcaceae bacterium]|nr:hypothetical protein [Myxococcaceae bacterium]